METLVHSVKVAMRSRHRQYQLRDYLVEREQLLARTYALFRELQHRVKNNLQVIQSLVRLRDADNGKEKVRMSAFVHAAMEGK